MSSILYRHSTISLEVEHDQAMTTSEGQNCENHLRPTREQSRYPAPEKYQDHFLEQYKLYVEMADRISQRRTSANNYLLTVNVFLTTLYSLSNSIKDAMLQGGWIYIVPMAGIAVCLTWQSLIRSYRNINDAKFKVIQALERRLPVAPYLDEWEIAERGQGKFYLPISQVEILIPFIFIMLYVFLAFLALFMDNIST